MLTNRSGRLVDPSVGREVLHPSVGQPEDQWVGREVLHPSVGQPEGQWVVQGVMLGDHLEVDPEVHQRHRAVERMLVGMFLQPPRERLVARAVSHPSEVLPGDLEEPEVDRKQEDLVEPEVGLQMVDSEALMWVRWFRLQRHQPWIQVLLEGGFLPLLWQPKDARVLW